MIRLGRWGRVVSCKFASGMFGFVKVFFGRCGQVMIVGDCYDSVCSVEAVPERHVWVSSGLMC